MNPVFLTIHDKALHELFQSKTRKVVNFRVNVAIIILWIYLALVCISRAKEIEKNFFFITMFGSCTVLTTICAIIARYKPGAIDYVNIN